MYEDAADNPRWKVTAHTLRHSFAVQSLKNGMDIRFLSKLMGHENLETTKKYLRVTNDDTKEMVRRYGAGTEELE
jgi:integrase/recombinase XerD